MIYGKEECRMLADSHAAVLVEDSFTENGTPIIVVRRVVGCGAVRSGRTSYWYVKLDRPLEDESAGVYPNHLLGYRTRKILDFSNLISRINTHYSLLPYHERQMLISDAICRLREEIL